MSSLNTTISLKQMYSVTLFISKYLNLNMPGSKVQYNGVECSGVEWSGVECSGVEWSVVEWSGVEWSGV